MDQVEIYHPDHGTKSVDRSTLGPYRRSGWVLATEKPTGINHLHDLRQSEVEESFSSEDSLDTEFDEEA